MKLELRKQNSSIVIIPLFNIVQSSVKSNVILMEQVMETLKELGLDVKLFCEEKGVYRLTAKGIDNIFSNL